MSSASLAATGAATAPTFPVEEQVVAAERVVPLADLFGPLATAVDDPGATASRIDRASYGFEVGRVHAATVKAGSPAKASEIPTVADVIEPETLRDRSDEELVGESMCAVSASSRFARGRRIRPTR